MRSEGGQVFPLGQFLQFGNDQERFFVNGTTLVFEHVTEEDGPKKMLRGFLRAQHGACSVGASAMLNDVPEPTTIDEVSCELYDGQK